MSVKRFVFVDDRLSSVIFFEQEADDMTRVIYIRSNDSNPFAQIRDALLNEQDVNAIHLIGHGSSGRLLLGKGWLDSQTVSTNTAILQQIGSHLSHNADILLYGCSVAASHSGQTLLSQLGTVLGADIAASADKVLVASMALSPNAASDGTLEVSTGEIESAVLSLASTSGQAVELGAVAGKVVGPAIPLQPA